MLIFLGIKPSVNLNFRFRFQCFILPSLLILVLRLLKITSAELVIMASTGLKPEGTHIRAAGVIVVNHDHQLFVRP